MNTFADFADAMARPARAAPEATPALGSIAVLGGGAEGRMLAAIALSEEAEVTLFTAYGAEREAMRPGITLRGAGPTGSYQVDSDAAPSVRTTADLDRAVRQADAIFLTGPIHKQRTYAMVLADHLHDGQVLVVAPGRTFGALETRWLLGIGGCAAEITIVEAALPFWCMQEGTVLQLSARDAVAGAPLPGGRGDICEALGRYFANAEHSTTTLRSSFGDGSGLVEVPALLFGGPAVRDGGPEIPMGGTPLAENVTFHNLVGPEHMAVISDLAGERREVARQFGVRDLPDDDAWLAAHAGAPTGEGARAVPTRAAAHAIIRDAVIGSLVPLVSAARLAGVPVPATEAMVGLASSVLRADLSTAGRTLPAMGVTGADPDSARRALGMAMA